MSLRGLVVAVVFLAVSAVAIAAGPLLSRDEVDSLFSLSRPEWEARAPRFVADGWKVRLMPVSTGTGVLAFNPGTGFGLSVQPFFAEGEASPRLLVVGSFFPVGQLPDLSGQVPSMQEAAQRDLGAGYAVTARYVRLSSTVEGVELSVSRSGVDR